MYFAIAGLIRSGDVADADEAARRFMRSVQQGYAADGTIREKYNVVAGTSEARVATGYKTNVVGFGWTNGLYLKCQHILRMPARAARAAIEP